MSGRAIGSMLHLVNGDSTARTLALSGVPGDIRSVDDVLMEGPVCAAAAAAEGLGRRADFLREYLGIPLDSYLAHVGTRRKLLDNAGIAEDTVLWFEEDVFCQVNFLEALARISTRRGAARRLSFVRPAEERLGRLTPERLAALFEERLPVQPALLVLAEDAWSDFTKENPVALDTLIKAGNFSYWPALRSGLKAHLARLPEPGSGLGRIERAILDAVHGGAGAFDEIFAAVSGAHPIYGFGDRQFVRYLLDMADPAAPLVSMELGPGGARPGWERSSWAEVRLAVAPLGKAVLAGDVDYMNIYKMERWVGNTRVAAGCRWRWDDRVGVMEIGG